LPGAVSYELVDGRLVDRGMGAIPSWVGGRLHRLLDEYCEGKRLGRTFPADASYQCFPDVPGFRCTVRELLPPESVPSEPKP
jgi:hypothetical protein